MIRSDYEALLVAAGFAKYGKKNIQILQDAWSEFIRGGDFVYLNNECKLDYHHKTVDLQKHIPSISISGRRAYYYVRIGHQIDGHFYDSIIDGKDANGCIIEACPQIPCL
jgi:hypothetical protein